MAWIYPGHDAAFCRVEPCSTAFRTAPAKVGIYQKR